MSWGVRCLLQTVERRAGTVDFTQGAGGMDPAGHWPEEARPGDAARSLCH